MANQGNYNRAPLTSYRNPPTSSQRPPMSSMGRNAPMSRGNPNMGNRTAMGPGGEARPMTSVSGAGYHGGIKDSRNFDPLSMGKGKGAAAPLAEKKDNSPEDHAKDLEKKVHRLMEASAIAIVTKDFQKGLEKAKEAAKAERDVVKYKENNGLVEQINIELTFSVFFSLANAFHRSKMYDDALKNYQTLVKKYKQYPQSAWIRVNMGNIYYEQKKYSQAIKMYRMALDQIPSTGKELRFRIFRNIGNAFALLGQYQDAIVSYDTIMSGSPDIHTGPCG